MIYCISDIHGRYDKYIEMLKKIGFTNDDELYLIGDICDRGDMSAQIYLDVMKRDNVHCIMGNHEKMLLEALPNSFGFLRKEFGCDTSLSFDVWSACGGGQTCLSLMNVGVDKILSIYRYVSSFPYYRVVEIEDKRFLLVHAGLGNYTHDKLLDEYAAEEFVWHELDYHDNYYPSYIDKVIVGHIPTFIINKKLPASIFFGDGNIVDIDCGAIFEEEGGRLGCICLNTMEEFYI